MKAYLFSLLFLVTLLTSCGKAPSTPNPAEVSLTMLADQVNAQATQAKLDSVFTITAQVVNATSTQQAMLVQATGTQQARLDAEATAEQERADAQATALQARQDAQATQQRIDTEATQAQARVDAESTAEQARLDVRSTQQASGTATAGAFTMTALPPAMTKTQIADEQNIILADNNIELSKLAVEQQREKNTPEWVVPYLIALVALGAAVLYVVRYSRVREVKNDDGDVEVLVMGDRVLRPRLLPGPIVELNKDEITMPMLVASSEQSKVTERAQAVDAIGKMPTTTTPQAASTFNKYFAPREEAPFEVIDAEDTPPAGLLDGETLKSLNKDWKEAKGE